MYACNPMALRHTTPPTYSNGMWFPGSVESQYSAPQLFGSSTNNSPDSAINTADTSPQRSSPATAHSTIRCNGPILLPKIRCQDQPKEPTAGTAVAPLTTNTQPSPVMSVVNNVNRPPVQMGVPTIHTQFSFSHPFKRRATASPEAGAVGIVDSPMSACSLPSSFFNGNTMVNTPTGLVDMNAPSSVRPSPLGAEIFPGNTGMTNTTLGPRLDTSAAISGSRRSSLAHVRSISHSTHPYGANSLPSPVDSHSRNASTGSGSTVIDENALMKHGYPTQYHRGMPQYITASPSPVTTPTVTLTPTLPVQPLPQTQPQHQDFNSYLIPPTPVTAESIISPQATSSPLFTTAEQVMLPPQPHPTAQTITLMKYLTAPGPTPNLISRSVTNLQAQRDFGWWDVRNLRSWSSFNMETLRSIPSLPELLNFPLDQNTLPHQGQNSPAALSRGNPENEYALRDTLFEFYGKRVNAALQVSQGRHKHLALRVMNSATTHPTPRPDFIVTYANDGFVRTTGRGELRGHVVGIVKAYDEWNTGMRSEDAPSKVKYLKGLAQLHRIMREHGCRYGFIVTEIELLCVRAGAEPHQPQMQQFNMMFHQHIPHVNAFGSDEGPKPIFGWLETSSPIPLSMASINEETGAYNMTAGLALWLLCMLARDEPLPGQVGWRMDVGGPAALTRQNKRPRDDWMPRVGVHESRVAKRIRGWIWPEDVFSRKEAPNVKRGRR